jgi:hypothetical protein
VWLLEELNLEYELKVFKRNAEFRAGDDLKQVHPLGRSPMIGITPAGSDKEILIFESATIVDYVCEHFGRQMLPQRYPEGKEGVLGAENEDFMRYRVSYTFSLRLYRISLHLHEPRCISNGCVLIGWPSPFMPLRRCYTAALSPKSFPIKPLHHRSYIYPRADLKQFLMDYAEGSLMTLLMIAMVISSTFSQFPSTKLR